jgi:hypothetical protein
MAGGLGTIVAATAGYEEWLRSHTPIIEADLVRKHEVMASSPFPFLRATAYRWAQRFPAVCPTLLDAPSVLAIGDLHVENFGTWRDAEGRLVWGVNDVDETTELPYASDLVRLLASVILATAETKLILKGDVAATAALEGYRIGLAGGDAMVLAENHTGLRGLATRSLKDPVQFWAHLAKKLSPETSLTPGIADAARAALPDGTTDVELQHRIAGVGSLGRPRVVAVGTLDGSHVAREAKAIVPSAWTFASPPSPSVADHAATMRGLVERAVRARDPGWMVRTPWLVRRLAPDCSRVEIADLPTDRDERKLLKAMGEETANLHLATAGAAPKILADLDGRGPKWLEAAAMAMAEDVRSDHAAWCKHGPSRG